MNNSQHSEILPCPFCGQSLKINNRKYNPYAKCQTEGCYGQKLPMLNIGLPEDVAAWNARNLESQVESMAMLIKLLVRALNRAEPGNETAKRAMDYLQNNDLLGSPLRQASGNEST